MARERIWPDEPGKLWLCVRVRPDPIAWVADCLSELHDNGKIKCYELEALTWNLYADRHKPNDEGSVQGIRIPE